jgi:hypothetical protein
MASALVKQQCTSSPAFASAALAEAMKEVAQQPESVQEQLAGVVNSFLNTLRYAAVQTNCCRFRPVGTTWENDKAFGASCALH